MQQINKRFLLSLAALLIVCGASLSGGTALAEHGSNSGTGGGTDSSNDSSVATNSTETQNETEQETPKSQSLRDQFRTQAQTKIQAELKTKAHARTNEQKQRSCEARKANLTKRMNNAVTAAQRHKEKFDKIYTRVQNFYETKKLNVADYDTLKASVDTAQQDAADQITALKGLNVSVDCTQTDSLATNVSAFQTAVKSTRDSLKTYRKSLVGLISALHGASTSTDKTDSTDNSSTNSTITQ
jgi:hypothetical protein